MNFDERTMRIGFVVLTVSVLMNLVVLDFWVISNKPIEQIIQRESGSVSKESAQCPASCISEIREATSSVKQTVAAPASKKSLETSSSVTSTTVSTPVQTGSSVKEFIIPFGGGSNSSEDWEDVAGLQAYVDSTKYGSIKSVVFEATMRIPTGNQTAYVRLYNATDKHPVWLSEMSLEGGTPKLLTSQALTLPSGNKLYQVQMKTQLKFQAILDQARLRITTY